MDKKALKYITTTDNYTRDNTILVDNTTYIYDINYNIHVSDAPTEKKNPPRLVGEPSSIKH